MQETNMREKLEKIIFLKRLQDIQLAAGEQRSYHFE